MIKTSYRLPLGEPLFSFVRKLRSVRRGSRVSRLARHIFSHPNIKKILGGNIALAVIAASLFPNPIEAEFKEVPLEIEVVKVDQMPIKTEIAIRYPLGKVKINQGYWVFHPGVDFEGITGDSVYPIKAGKIESVQFSRFLYGNAVIINHGDGLTSLYAHLSKIRVKAGDEVSPLTRIGEVGSTGRSTGDHLHLEVHRNGRPVNPFSVLPKLEPVKL